MRDRTVFLGIGSPHGNDQIGWHVADALAMLDPQLRVFRVDAPIDLLDHFENVDRAVLCDACTGLGSQGATSCWQWPAAELEPVAFVGTHDLGLTSVLQLAETLNRLPAQVIIWGIDAGAPSTHASLSPELASAIPQLARTIYHELAHA
jgi:hydrogenase maturation protease